MDNMIMRWGIYSSLVMVHKTGHPDLDVNSVREGTTNVVT